MKSLVLFTLLLLCVTTRAAVPTLGSFEPTQFATNGNMVAIRADWTNEVSQIHPATVNDGVTVTNFTLYGTLVLPDKVTFLTLGTNYLDMAATSSWLLYSPTNDASQVILSLSAGLFQGQLAFIQSQNSDGAFTLPDLSEQYDVPGAYVDISGDWIATTNRGIILRYTAPDWVEASRADPSSTNGPFGGISGMVNGYYPFGTNNTDLLPGLLYSGNPQTVELRSTINNTPFIVLNPLNTNVTTGTFEVRQHDSDGEQSAMWVNGGKSGGWGLGTPGARDGFFSVNVLHDNSMAQRMEIDGNTGLVTFFSDDGLSTIAEIANASGYTGAGTLFLSDDGTYKVAAGISGLTTGQIPKAASSTSLDDSIIQQVAASNLIVDNSAGGGGTFQLKFSANGNANWTATKDYFQYNNAASITVLNVDTNGALVMRPAAGGATNIFVASPSGYTGAGTLFLSDDGTYKSAGGGSSLWASSGGNLVPSPAVDVVTITSQSADNATNILLNLKTATPWTGGKFISTSQTNAVFDVRAPYGGVSINSTVAEDQWGSSPYTMVLGWMDTSLGDPNEWEVVYGTSDGASNYSYLQEYGDDSSAALLLSSEGAWGNTRLYLDSLGPQGADIQGITRGIFGFWLGSDQQINDSAAYGFDTSTNVTSGFHTKWKHQTGDIVTLDLSGNLVAAGSFKGGTPSGGTAAAWKPGVVVTGASVTLSATNYVQVDINGTLVKLGVVQ